MRGHTEYPLAKKQAVILAYIDCGNIAQAARKESINYNTATTWINEYKVKSLFQKSAIV